MARRVWTSVDFSGCTLTSGDQQVIVIISLWVNITSNSDELDIQSLKQQVMCLTRVSPSLEIINNNVSCTHNNI